MVESFRVFVEYKFLFRVFFSHFYRVDEKFLQTFSLLIGRVLYWRYSDIKTIQLSLHAEIFPIESF